jgi:hypothetical protein
MDSKEFFTEWIRRYRSNPVRFIREQLGYEPDEWQCSVAMDVANNKRVTVRSGQGVGKTALEAAMILWFLTVFSYPRVVATAPTQQQLRDVLWTELAKWQNKSPILSEILKWTKTYLLCRFSETRWFATARVAVRPENMQGFHEDNMLFVVDEASGIKDNIMEAILGTLTGENNKLLMCGNPTRSSGIFFDSHNGRRGNFIVHRVNSEDSPRTNKENISALANAYGRDSNVYRVRVLGEFPVNEDDVFISLQMAEQAVNTEPDISGKISFGVDVARFGSDKTVIAMKEGNSITFPTVRQGQNLMQTVGDIVALYRESLRIRPKYSGNITVNIDDTGLGGGVTDRLKEVVREEQLTRMEVVPVNFGGKITDKNAADNYGNFGTWLWAMLRDGLRDGVLALPNNTELIAELSTRKYTINSTGKIVLEGKDEMKKRGLHSPDLGDAAALACYARKPFAFAISSGDSLPKRFRDDASDKWF